MLSFGVTTSLLEQLRDETRRSPLHEQEIRRIVGMGHHYLARASACPTERGLMSLFKLVIDGVEYVVGVPETRSKTPEKPALFE